LIPLFKGKCILELGSGTGILGLCVNEFNPNKIILSDLEINTKLLISNKQLNI